ncbi:MAG: hypothetical protein WC141_00345 [Arcobacteraceae bacterium]
MNLIISLLYAPIVFYSLRNFEIPVVSLCIGFASFLWLIFSIKKGITYYIFPLVYLTISLLAFFLNDMLFLKLLPAILSGLISFFILYTYVTNNSFIFLFLERIHKKVEENEKKYIQQSTLFWFFISLFNLLIHCYILYIQDIIYWTYYSSIGWYGIFMVGGIIQFIHKKIFLNRRNFA